MKRLMFVFAISAAVMFATAPAYALQRGHSGAPKRVAHAPAPHPPSTHSQGSTHGGGSSAHGTQTRPTGGSHRSGTVASVSGTTKTKPTTKTKLTTTTATTTRTTTTIGTLSPAQQKLQKNTNLATKLSTRLNGADVVTAAAGFRNLGQFVAAVNVSSNLGIPFTDLKTRMVDDGMSLGQAIHELRPKTSADVEARHAEQDADAMIRQTSGTAVRPVKKTKTGKGGE